MKIFWIFITSFLIISCSTGKTNLPIQKKSVKTIALEKLGENYKISENTKGNLVLLWTKKADKATKDKIMKLHFIVLDLEKNNIIIEKKFDNSSVYWKDNYKLKIISTPEILTTNEETNNKIRTEYIDLQNRFINILPRKNK